MSDSEININIRANAAQATDALRKTQHATESLKKSGDGVNSLGARLSNGLRGARDAAVKHMKSAGSAVSKFSADTEKALKDFSKNFKVNGASAGRALQSLASGNIAGATKAIGGMGGALGKLVPFVALVVAGFKGWASVLEKIQNRIHGLKVDELAMLTGNAAANAQSAARQYSNASAEIEANARRSANAAGLASEIVGANDSSDRAYLDAERQRALAGAGSQAERDAINKRHAEDSGRLDSDAAQRKIDEAQAGMTRDREALEARVAALVDGIKGDNRVAGQYGAAAQAADENAEDYMPDWMSRNIFKQRGARLAGQAQGFVDEQSAATSGRESSVRAAQEKLAQLKEARAMLAELEERERSLIPAMQESAEAAEELQKATREAAEAVKIADAKFRIDAAKAAQLEAEQKGRVGGLQQMREIAGAQAAQDPLNKIAMQNLQKIAGQRMDVGGGAGAIRNIENAAARAAKAGATPEQIATVLAQKLGAKEAGDPAAQKTVDILEKTYRGDSANTDRIVEAIGKQKPAWQ